MISEEIMPGTTFINFKQNVAKIHSIETETK